jgi:hypothetical protein
MAALGGAGSARRALRLAVLAFASLVIAHEVTYHVHHGGGAELEARMHALGHDAWWPAFSLLALSAAIVLTVLSAAHLVRLWLRGRTLGLSAGPPRACDRPYSRELGRLWLKLLPITSLAFTVQENVEHALAGEGLIGLGALGGHEYALALPVLALVTLLVAAVGAALRWHAEQLEAGIARALWQLLRPAGRTLPPVLWWIVSALCAHAWIRALNHAVRAPPAILRI